MSEKEKIQEAPKGWKDCRLSEIANIQGGFAFKSNAFISDGIRLIKITNIFNEKVITQINDSFIKINNRFNSFLLNENDVIIALSGATTGKVGRVKKHVLPAYLNQRVGRFNNKKNSSIEFIFYLTTYYYFLEEILNNAASSAQPNISPKFLENIIIRVPKSISEQRTIASILSTCDEAIEKTDAKIEKLKRIKHGLMQDLFRYGIDENGKMRSETTHRFKDSPLGRIPEEWEVVELCCQTKRGNGGVQTGPFGSQLHANDYVDEGIPIITVEHLVDFNIGRINLPKVSKRDYLRLSKYKLKEGDSVFSRVGSIDRCSYTTKLEDGWLFSGRCLRVRPGKYFHGKYLAYQLNTHEPINWILNNAVGSTMKCLNTSILSRLKISVPKSVPEQSRIASILSSADEAIEKEEAYKQKLLAIKRGLMEDLLSGKVRVNKLIREAA